MLLRNVVVGLSGGVDSAVAAYLLKSKGFNVIGAFMKNWDENDETGHCSSLNDRHDALYVCKKLNIPFVEVNFVKQYWSEVFSEFLYDYEQGITPNPDIICNKRIKFRYFFDYCFKQVGCDAVATGHYAQSSYGNYLEHINDFQTVKLLEAYDKFKDQTFFLSQISQKALRRIMFPVGGLLKSEVKKIAELNNLKKIVIKKESTGICFIGKRNFQQFISDYIPPKPGLMIDLSSGHVIGEHAGLHTFTIGQCCRIKGYLNRYFVASKDAKENVIYVVPGTSHPALFTKYLYTAPPHFIRPEVNQFNVQSYLFRFQHTKPTVPCTAIKLKTGLLVILDRPLKAITPGQYAVFYDGKECLGSARIIRPGSSLLALNDSVPADYEEYEHYSKVRYKAP